MTDVKNSIVDGRIFQIPENARLGRANFYAGRFQPARDAVIAQRAFLGRAGFRIQKAAAVRTGLDAEPTTNTILRIHQHRAIWSVEGRAHRADLGAGRGLAKVAKLRHKKRLEDVFAIHGRRRKAVATTIGRIHQHFPAQLDRPGLGFFFTERLVLTGHGFLDDVTLDPSAEISRSLRHMVLCLAGIHAQAATDAAVHVNRHEPFVLARIVTLGRVGGGEQFLHRGLAGPGGGRANQPRKGARQDAQHSSSGKFKFHGTSFG